MLPLIALAAAAADPCSGPPATCITIIEPPVEITVSASRTPVALADTGISISQLRRDTIEGLSLPLVKDYLTLVPGVAVAPTGP